MGAGIAAGTCWGPVRDLLGICFELVLILVKICLDRFFEIPFYVKKIMQWETLGIFKKLKQKTLA